MKHLIAGLLVLVVSAVAGATLPKIDPSLKKYFGPSDVANDNITVIVMFHDKTFLPRTEHSPTTHAEVEVALQNNARVSQTPTMQKLFQAKESGLPIKAESLWLFNAAIMHVPASQLKELAQNEDIISITANRQVHLLDQDMGAAVGSGSGYTYGLEKINLPALRAKAPTLTGQGVRVGILDTGIDATHPDLKDRVMTFKDFVGNQTTPYDDNSHGTHVAGTISGGNASGTTIGVAPGVKLIIGKVFSGSGSAGMDELLKAMQWIADPDGNPATNDYPQIVSNSWGGGDPSPGQDPMDDPFCKAIAGWVKVGILPVFAAGNSGPGSGSVNVPGACPQSMTVGATDKNDQIASFSSRGPAKWKSVSVVKPTISAPGVHVISSVPGGGYKAFDGTSMATPHAAGLAALVIQAVPNITVENIQKLIVAGATHLGTADDSDPNNTYGAGRIDAFNTIKTAITLMHGGTPETIRPSGEL
jgi:subtilisin family serine protease